MKSREVALEGFDSLPVGLDLLLDNVHLIFMCLDELQVFTGDVVIVGLHLLE